MKDAKIRSALERLEGQLEVAESRAEGLEEELETYKTIENWSWCRHLQVKYKDEPDAMLVPRLEMRQEKISDFEAAWMQYLVLDDFAAIGDGLVYVPLGRTTSSSARSIWEREVELPYRDGAHIYHHMVQTGLPGYLTRFEDGEMVTCKRLSLDDDNVRDYTKTTFPDKFGFKEQDDGKKGKS